MRFKIYFKSLFGYMGMLLLFTFIHFFVDSNLGTALLASLIILLLCSGIGFVVSIYMVRVQCSKNDIKAIKGEEVEFRVKISTKVPIPLCFIQIVQIPQKYIKPLSEEYYITMVSNFKPYMNGFKYKSAVLGVDVIGIDNVYIRDFMGLFRYSKKLHDNKIRVKTVPLLIERFYDQSVTKFKNFAADYDDSEEINGGLTTSSGFPGYDYREYQDGDSMRRINYKLSAKRDKLFIRLDEPIASLRQAVLLDNVSSRDRYKDERMIEGMIAYVGCLVMEKICTEVYFMTEDKQMHMQLNSMKDVAGFVDAISDAFFVMSVDIRKNIDIKRIERISAITVFSSSAYADRLIINKNMPHRIITCNKELTGENVLYIDKFLNISRGGGRSGKTEENSY